MADTGTDPGTDHQVQHAIGQTHAAEIPNNRFFHVDVLSDPDATDWSGTTLTITRAHKLSDTYLGRRCQGEGCGGLAETGYSDDGCEMLQCE